MNPPAPGRYINPRGDIRTVLECRRKPPDRDGQKHEQYRSDGEWLVTFDDAKGRHKHTLEQWERAQMARTTP